jgi:transcriptional regulator of acetoin/glycerol metabolism
VSFPSQYAFLPNQKIIMDNRATLREHRDIEDTRYLKRLLTDVHGNVTQAARIAGIHRATMNRLMIRLGIVREYPVYERPELMKYRRMG